METERRDGKIRGADEGSVLGSVRGLVAGDRAYLFALIGLLTLASLMISGPLHHYLEGRDRLQLLDRKRVALTAEVERLERRAADLEDPVYIEQLAREQLGLVRPGEIPYLVVTPDPEPDERVPADRDTTPPWYRRVWKTLANLVH
ncbi:MAG: septum formation initiator family protein [Actinomycetota bacterium]|nr:septum formation initiator family protein [Actinomycetota bacterium]